MPDMLDLGLTIRFLAELSQNNNKAWFDRHRLDYEAARDAFYAFIDCLIDEFRTSDHLEGLSARDCIARIYRDIRFSKNKSPYKSNMGALVAPGGWKGGRNGYYISIEPGNQSMVAGGLYAPTPEQLNRFRQVIAEDATEFHEISRQEDLIEAFGGVEGERLKTVPKGYDPAHPEIDLLRLKQILVLHRFTDQEVLVGDFQSKVIFACRAMRPFLDYLDEVLD